jgi:TrwC relaxase
MSMHKLTAGAGYDYLTRQVAALDSTEKGHTGLASYYTERGETPGAWIGSGLNGIDGLTAGNPVTAEQMRALFGCGLHPLAELGQQQLEGPGLAVRNYQDAARLGRRSRSLTATSAHSGSKWHDASQRSGRRLAFLPALRCLQLIGRGCGPRWPGSSSLRRMAESRLTRGNWLGRSRKTRGPEHRPWPGMT